jgi:hypothetical protein
MAKIYLINQNSKELPLRNLFQRELDKLGFIENLLGDDKVEILEEQTGQKIIISGLNDEQVKGVWKVNLEMEIAGISSKNTSKTPEAALLVLTKRENDANYILHIFLVELKSSLQDSKIEKSKPLGYIECDKCGNKIVKKTDNNISERKPSTLEDCERKLKAGMNRLYMLLSLNEYKNDNNFNNTTIMIKFKGIIAYKKNQTTKDDNTELYQILQGNISNQLLTCKTIFTDKDKIKIYFSNHETIDLSQLLN